MFSDAAPQRFGSTWFRPVLPEGATSMVLQVSETVDGPGRVLVDPAEDGEGATVALWKPSPDGTLVAVATGAGALHMRIIRVADGEIVVDFGQRSVMLLEWTPDSSGAFHHEIVVSADSEGNAIPESQLWWQPLDGDAVRQDLEVDHPFFWPVVDPAGMWMAITADQTGPRPRWITRIGSGEWKPFLRGATGSYKGTFVGDEFWAITDDVSGWCRLVAIPVESVEDPSTWREIVPALEEAKLASITRCGDFLALSLIENGTMRLRVLGLDGADQGEVELPGRGLRPHRPRSHHEHHGRHPVPTVTPPSSFTAR